MTRTITAVHPCLGAGRRNGKWRQTPTRSGQRRRAMFADRLWRRPWNKQEPWETGRQFAGDRSSLTSEPGLYRFYLQLIADFSGRILVRRCANRSLQSYPVCDGRYRLSRLTLCALRAQVPRCVWLASVGLVHRKRVAAHLEYSHIVPHGWRER